MLAHGVLSNHTSNLTSSQSLGVSLQELSSRMERNEVLDAFGGVVGRGERDK